LITTTIEAGGSTTIS